MKWNWIYGVVFAAALTIPAPRHRFRCISDIRPRGPVTNAVDRYLVRATPGSMATGRRKGVAISGCRGAGTVRLIKGRAGSVPVIITSTRAGSYVRATGTMTNMVIAAITEVVVQF